MRITPDHSESVAASACFAGEFAAVHSDSGAVAGTFAEGLAAAEGPEGAAAVVVAVLAAAAASAAATYSQSSVDVSPSWLCSLSAFKQSRGDYSHDLYYCKRVGNQKGVNSRDVELGDAGIGSHEARILQDTSLTSIPRESSKAWLSQARTCWSIPSTFPIIWTSCACLQGCIRCDACKTRQQLQ